MNVPTNSTPVVGHYEKVVRFHRYKPNSEQAKRGIEGRWQEWNEHGWSNCDAPNSWEAAGDDK